MSNNDLKISLLGDLCLKRGSEQVSLPKSRKARALFAYLAVADKPVSRAWLAHFLFSDSADPKGNLRWCLSRLRSSCAQLSNNIIGSSNSELWLDSPSESIDVHRLPKLFDKTSFDEPEYEILERVTQRGFLPDLELANSLEFEAWRATVQSQINSTAENILDKAVSSSFGTECAVRFAHLFVSFAPHSERAWFLLVMALEKTKQTAQAQKFLQIAHQQLQSHKVLHTGLLALAANDLKSSERAFNIDDTSRNYSTVTNKRPRIALETLTNNEPIAREFEDAVSAALVTNKAFDIVTQGATPEPLSDVDFVLSLTLNSIEDQHQIELKLRCNHAQICLWNWELELRNSDSKQALQSFRKWLGERFELDIPLAMYKQAQQKEADQLSASDYYFLALPRIHTPVGYSAPDTLTILQKSLQLDANFGPALCAMAWVRATHGYYNEVKQEREKSAKMARRAIELSHDDASIVAWAGISVAHLELNVDLGLSFAERALKLNQHSPLANLLAALMHHYNGNYQLSFNYLQQLNGSDIEPLTFLADTCYSINHYQLGQLDEAIQFGRRAVDRNPRYNLALRALTASLVRSGKVDEAQVFAKRMLALETSEYIDYYKKFALYKDELALERFCGDLAKAGIPQNDSTL